MRLIGLQLIAHYGCSHRPMRRFAVALSLIAILPSCGGSGAADAPEGEIDVSDWSLENNGIDVEKINDVLVLKNSQYMERCMLLSGYTVRPEDLAQNFVTVSEDTEEFSQLNLNAGKTGLVAIGQAPADADANSVGGTSGAETDSPDVGYIENFNACSALASRQISSPLDDYANYYGGVILNGIYDSVLADSRVQEALKEESACLAAAGIPDKSGDELLTRLQVDADDVVTRLASGEITQAAAVDELNEISRTESELGPLAQPCYERRRSVEDAVSVEYTNDFIGDKGDVLQEQIENIRQEWKDLEDLDVQTLEVPGK